MVTEQTAGARRRRESATDDKRYEADNVALVDVDPVVNNDRLRVAAFVKTPGYHCF